MTAETVESWLVLGGTVVYTERPTEAEARKVLDEQRHLIEKFGTPRLELHVIIYNDFT